MTWHPLKQWPEVGAVVTKSTGIAERIGYGNPSVVELDAGLLNAMGLPNPGVDSYVEELSTASTEVIIGSVFGSSKEEFTQVAMRMAQATHAIEMNMSCPHAESYGADVPVDHLADLVAAVKEVVTIPVFVKLGADNIISRAHQAVKGGADALVAINTVKGMAIDVETGVPILANKIGGYSGPAIKPIGVRCVFELASAFDIPIIGVGGISCADDVLEYLMAGASAVQLGSALHYHGKTVFTKINHDLQDWLQNHGYDHIQDVVGQAI